MNRNTEQNNDWCLPRDGKLVARHIGTKKVVNKKKNSDKPSKPTCMGKPDELNQDNDSGNWYRVSRLSNRIQSSSEAANTEELSSTETRMARFGLQNRETTEPNMGVKTRYNTA